MPSDSRSSATAVDPGCTPADASPAKQASPEVGVVMCRAGIHKMTALADCAECASVLRWCSYGNHKLMPSEFGALPGKGGQLRGWCNGCRKHYEKLRRAGIMRDRATNKSWRAVPETPADLLKRLAGAASRARSSGMWRGQNAIRAYRDLGIALELCGRYVAEDEQDRMEPYAPDCTCPTWPCPRHVYESANPADTEIA